MISVKNAIVILGFIIFLRPVQSEIPIGQCFLKDPLPFTPKYHNPGDLLIAGMIPVFFSSSYPVTLVREPSEEQRGYFFIIPQVYQHVLALVFAVREVNRNPKLLPNTTLGFHIYDSNYFAQWIYLLSLKLLSSEHKFVPNYKCGVENHPIALIAGPQIEVSYHTPTILNNYKILQLMYGAASQKKEEATFFYQMFPNDEKEYRGILQLLNYFRWTWIVMVFSDDFKETFGLSIIPLFANQGICIDFIEIFPKLAYVYDHLEYSKKMAKLCHRVAKSTATVVVVKGDIGTIMRIGTMIMFAKDTDPPLKEMNEIWIMTAQVDFTSISAHRNINIDYIHGSISFSRTLRRIPEFQTFLQGRNPTSEKDDGFIRSFWEQSFSCVFPSSTMKEAGNKFCTGEEKLETLPTSVFEMDMTPHSYSIYNGLHAIAHALHDMHLYRSKQRAMGERKMDHQLFHFLQRVSFNNNVGEKIYFDENRELVTGYDIMNWILFPNMSFRRIKVGSLDPQASQDTDISIHEDFITWPPIFNQRRPLSLCNEICSSGYRKREKEGKPSCCYDCLRCQRGSISTGNDSEYCFQCTEDSYPNSFQDSCIPKQITYLSFEEPLGISLTIWALSFSFITVLILRSFIKHRDTPIVKANNRSLTYSLLISLLLSFLCSLFFIGQPNRVTCLLRQASFGIIFSMAISCVLAKTITVVVAFMATKPGSVMRKWVGGKLATSLVLSCSLTQASICIVWLSISPPFPYFDTQTMAKEIVFECNEGKRIMFYCILGFMGFLATLSFTVAFLARKLPDTFNEAKFITFSMLMFSSVWLTFIPTYLSTKGKYTVAVEISSILASSSGLLGCIFFPKCYIILLKPELNDRQHLGQRKQI